MQRFLAGLVRWDSSSVSAPRTAVLQVILIDTVAHRQRDFGVVLENLITMLQDEEGFVGQGREERRMRFHISARPTSTLGFQRETPLSG